MAALSVNVNKIALLRNSRGRDYPSVTGFAEQFLQLGADGVTLHPRQDQRHARYDDCVALQSLCQSYAKELNIEGYPSEEFLAVVEKTRPVQCTLVPDDPNQLTSDHGWDLSRQADFLQPICQRLNDCGVRVSLFMDCDAQHIELAKEIGAARIELYTEPYAQNYATEKQQSVLEQFKQQALLAQQIGLGINAGHDLNLDNLADFIVIENLLEVSIGHALVVESLQLGINEVTRRYLDILHSS